MKRVFFKYNDSLDSYCLSDKKEQTLNFELQNLKFVLETKNPYKLHVTPSNNKIKIWSSDNIKQKAMDTHFDSLEAKTIFNESYSKYSAKRWDDMPTLEMTLQNYEMIVQKWQDIVLKQRPNYIIFSQDNAGYVDLVGKDTLSEQDLADIKDEHEKYLKYKTAWEKYETANPNRSEVWRSPADDEYEADWQKYYDQE